MRRIAVVPGEATARAVPLLRAASWEAAPTRGHVDSDTDLVADVVRRGEAALYVPREATPASELRRILVVHHGTRGDRAGMDAADEAAVASGAEVLVVYTPPSTPSASMASLPFRIADHGAHDWAEWREEFLRRFCRSSPGVRVTLRVSGTTTLGEQIHDESPDLVIVSAPGQGDAAMSEVLDTIHGDATPLLIVPSIGKDRTARKAAERGQRP